MLAFGPVPSRRLGRSLGVNHIPPKICSYACVYCQLGDTLQRRGRPRAYYPPERVLAEVQAKLEAAGAAGERVDALTLVPDGEPTLDANLGALIRGLKRLGPRVAVISNGSLVSDPAVRAALGEADWVSLKVDAADPALWERVNRPDPGLDLSAIQRGMEAFARDFEGELVSETMLVAELNDGEAALRALAAFLQALRPACAYLAAPVRPPALGWVRVPDEARLTRAYGLFSEVLPRVELLTGDEGDAFAATGDAASDLLSITAVHPMRASAVRALLARTGADWSVVEALLQQGRLVETRYRDTRFFARKLHTRR